jgi:hypothetical protein
MRPGFIVLLFALSFAAYAQEGYLGSDHDKWHQSFYSMLQRPDGKGSCCNLTDCRPTSGRTVDASAAVGATGLTLQSNCCCTEVRSGSDSVLKRCSSHGPP